MITWQNIIFGHVNKLSYCIAVQSTISKKKIKLLMLRIFFIVLSFLFICCYCHIFIESIYKGSIINISNKNHKNFFLVNIMKDTPFYRLYRWYSFYICTAPITILYTITSLYFDIFGKKKNLLSPKF